eukprot:scaffold4628_cov98-Cylindrotheca_fusiformis.AAC.2
MKKRRRISSAALLFVRRLYYWSGTFYGELSFSSACQFGCLPLCLTTDTSNNGNVWHKRCTAASSIVLHGEVGNLPCKFGPQRFGLKSQNDKYRQPDSTTNHPANDFQDGIGAAMLVHPRRTWIDPDASMLWERRALRTRAPKFGFDDEPRSVDRYFRW